MRTCVSPRRITTGNINWKLPPTLMRLAHSPPEWFLLFFRRPRPAVPFINASHSFHGTPGLSWSLMSLCSHGSKHPCLSPDITLRPRLLNNQTVIQPLLLPAASRRFLRKEGIQPHLPIRLPCYDFTPVIRPAFGSSSLSVRSLTSGISDSHGVTGGVYKTRERIHRDILIRDY